MNTKIKNKVFYAIISLVAVFAIGSVVVAYSLNNTINVEGDYNNYEAERAISDIPADEFGAIVGPDIYNKLYLHDGFWSGSTISEGMTWATTSEGGAQIVNVKKRNEGLDKFCNPQTLVLDISTALAAFGGSYQVGTTTKSGDDSLTNTTTATLIATYAITTTTAERLNTSADGGTYFTTPDTDYASTTPFVWGEGEYIVVSMAGEGGATSSDSFSPSTGGAAPFAGVGRLHLNCWNRFIE